MTNVVLALLAAYKTPVQYDRLREMAWDLRGWPPSAEAPSCRSGERGPERGHGTA